MVLAGPEAIETQAHSEPESRHPVHTQLCPACLCVAATGVGVSLPMGTAGEGGGAGWHIQEASKYTLGSLHFNSHSLSSVLPQTPGTSGP